MITAALLLAFSLGPTPAHCTAGQQKPPENTNPDSRPEVKKAIEELDAHVKKEGKEDGEAVSSIDSLHMEFAKSGPKDRQAIVAALDKVFTARRLENKDGLRDSRIYIAAAVSLRDMAPESPKVLMNWIGHKDHRKDIALQEKLIQSLGKTKDDEGRKFLLKELNDKSPRVIAAAAEALSEYSDIEQKARKETFETLLKLLMEMKQAYDASNASKQQDPVATERWNTVSAPIITTLQHLAKHEETNPEEWQRWWNKNKKAEWDEKKS